jgi:hypothetical protein
MIELALVISGTATAAILLRALADVMYRAPEARSGWIGQTRAGRVLHPGA